MDKNIDFQALASSIKQEAIKIGFAELKITTATIPAHEQNNFKDWLSKNYHGDMDYLAKNAELKLYPQLLVPNVISILSVRLHYMPLAQDPHNILQDNHKAYISRYALGRDYHKVIRNKLQKLAEFINQQVGEFGYRAFTDSAPILEIAIAQQAGLGFRGKNTLLLTKQEGSFFFLGELFTTLPLPIDPSYDKNHCGKCTACIDVCPTGAIISPYVLDARKCLSYLTIENKGSIDIQYRKALGNRIYGCDDCQLFCPWNRFAPYTQEQDFQVRHHLDDISLLELFSWDEETFLKKMAGSAIRRIGYERWQRNIAVALGNAKTSLEITKTLEDKLEQSSALVREHILWALEQHSKQQNT